MNKSIIRAWNACVHAQTHTHTHTHTERDESSQILSVHVTLVARLNIVGIYD
jgi:hypothetical protein